MTKNKTIKAMLSVTLSVAILLSCVVVGMAKTITTYGEEIVSNGDFEGTYVDGSWFTFMSATGSDVEVAAGEGVESTNALFATNRTLFYDGIAQKIADPDGSIFEANATYEISAMVRVPEEVTNGTKLKLVTEYITAGSGGAYIGQTELDATAVPNTDWFELKATFTLPETEITELQISVNECWNGNVENGAWIPNIYVDNFSVKKLTTTTVIDPPEESIDFVLEGDILADKTAIDLPALFESYELIPGLDLTVRLSIAEVAKLNNNDMALLGDSTIGAMYDIDLRKYMGVISRSINETEQAIDVTIQIPEELKGQGYEIVEIHDGKAAVLADKDADEATYTFEANSFSYFVLAKVGTLGTKEDEKEAVADVNGTDGNTEIALGAEVLNLSKIYASSGTVFVPAEEFLAEFGASKSDYDAKTGKFTVDWVAETMIFEVGETSFNLDGIKTELTAAPEVVNGDLYLPLDFLTGYMGLDMVEAGDDILLTIKNITNKPEIAKIYTVSPDVLAFEITEGSYQRSYLVEKEAGVTYPNGSTEKSGGKYVLIPSTIDKEFLNTILVQDAAQYTITNGSKTVAVKSVDRKSTLASDVAEPKNDDGSSVMRTGLVTYNVYLNLDQALTEDATYEISTGDINFAETDYEFTYSPKNNWSEAIHTNQSGYAPEDEGKRAFLSVWKGDGDNQDFANGLEFYVIDEATEKVVYTGDVKLAKDMDEADRVRIFDWPDDSNGDGIKEDFFQNLSKTDVYYMDFSDVTTPGNYRVCVEGVGCSYTVKIDENAWLEAFELSMLGFYNQRVVTELEEEYTDYTRPENFTNIDFYQTGATVRDTANGMAYLSTDNFQMLIDLKTDEIVENVVGGYADAADWDARIGHVDGATYSMLELFGMNKEYFENLQINIPEQNNEIPDLLDECLWNLQLYKNLQMENGAIRGGFEFETHPNTETEPSWLTELEAYVYAPDSWAGFIYVASAAKIAGYLEEYDSALAQEYKESAIAAMEWSVEDYANWLKLDQAVRNPNWKDEKDYYNKYVLAAVEMYRLTGDAKWKTIVDENVSDESDPAIIFAYSTLPAELVLADFTTEDAVAAIEAKAALMIAHQNANAFGLTHDNGDMMPDIVGYYGSVNADFIAKAHYLTGNSEYLKSLVLASNFALGANAGNRTFTSGLGYDHPEYQMCMDGIHLGQVPDGITTYAGFPWYTYADGKMSSWVSDWYIEYTDTASKNDGDQENNQPAIYPAPELWPEGEQTYDCSNYGMYAEYTIHQSMAPLNFALGYLAAKTDKVDPVLVSGDGQTVEAGAEAEFVSSASFGSFEKVLINGKVISSDNYIVEDDEEGTKVTLKAEYLETLTAGLHEITIGSTEGNVFGMFTVEEVEVTPTPAPTKEPEATATPAPTKEPEATATPAPTKEPEATATPAPTKEPEVTATPAPTKEPEATVTPAPTKEPEVTTTPAPTVEPDDDVPSTGDNSNVALVVFAISSVLLIAGIVVMKKKFVK